MFNRIDKEEDFGRKYGHGGKRQSILELMNKILMNI